MMRRLFFAVDLPEEVKEELYSFRERIRGSFERDPVKWVDKDSLHITLAFLGNVREDLLSQVIKEARTVEKRKGFSVTLNRIGYFPPGKDKARMIWAFGDSEDLEGLYNDLSLTSSFIDNNRKERFLSHVTLGRIRKWEMRSIPFSRIPEIEEEVNISFPVTGFDLMESKLTRKGPEYKTIERFSL